MSQFASLIQDCETCIRSGHPHKVAKLLAGVNLSRVPSESRLDLARICRRAGLYSVGLKLLNKVLNPKEADSADQSELAEYSALLVRSGAISEALERLNAIDTIRAPEALLFRAYALFSLRDFDAAILSLEEYLRNPLNDYARLVGQTNLGFAYAGNHNSQMAIKVLSENIKLTGEHGYRQLQSTCFALRGQAYLHLNELLKAREDLRAAQALSDQSHTNDNFLATQWQLILEGLETKTQAPFDQLRTMALAHQNWEACRDADFFSLKVIPNRELFVHLYCGTPFVQFRRLIEEELGGRPAQPIYVYGKKAHPRLDLETGLLDGKECLPFAGKIHQLIEALFKDFYQQPRVAGLFSSLFPGEHFDVSSSPMRIHQLIFRTRELARAESLPFQIVETNGFYSLRIAGALSFRVPLERKTPDLMSHKYELLLRSFGSSKFTAGEIQKRLDLSKTTAHEFLQWALEKGKIECCGQVKRAHLYAIRDISQNKAA